MYGNGYSATSRTVRLFWEVVDDFSPQQRAALMRFVTSCSRAPLGGFKYLQPPFTVHRVDVPGRNPLAGFVGKDVELLPSARCAPSFTVSPSSDRKRCFVRLASQNTGV